MRKILFATLMLASLTVGAHPPSAQAPRTVIENLDVQTISSYLKAKNEKAKKTFRDFGLTMTDEGGSTITVQDEERRGAFQISVAKEADDGYGICVRERVPGKADFGSGRAYWLKKEKSGMLKAQAIANESAKMCGAFASHKAHAPHAPVDHQKHH